MKRWMNALGRYKGSVILIIIFLIVEALCDITLPGYTSKMIDTGIQNSGIEHVAPEKITKEEYEYAQLFMDDEEKQLWDNSYTENGDIYELKSLSKKELDNLDDKLSGALIMNNQLSSVDESTFEKMMNQGDSQTKITPEMLGIKEFPADLRPIIINMVQAGRMNSDNLISMKNELNSKLDEIGATIKNSMGIAYAKKMDKMAGVDVDAVQQRFLWTNGGIMIVIAAIMAVAMIINALLAAKVGAAIGRDLREQTYENVMKFSNSEIEKFSTASLITRTTNDIQQIQQSTTLVLRIALYSPILAAAGIVQVILTGSGMGWIIGLAVALIFGVLAILMGLAVPKFKSVQKLIDNVNRISREILTGMPVIRAFNREKKEEVRFEKSNKDLFKTQLFIGKIMSFLMPVLMFIMFGMSVLIIWVGGHKIDEGTLQIGQMTSFITYSMLIVMSFLMLTMLALIVPRAMVAADRIDEVITTESSIKNADNAVELNNPKGVVEFKNVNFAYDGAEGDMVLKDISFKAEPGKTTAIIGSTGCGKTTLIQLIPRLYDVTDGEITIDGINVKDIDIKSLRKAIGYVPQKRILFSGTIATNIAYGNDDATMEDIEKAAKIAQAEEFIESKEDKYDSPISQGGTNVSGGQNQRLQIARALAKHPKILLFDDSFSALDMKTDKLLRETLSKEVKDATLIIVAQRVGTIINADQIIVLDEGSIVGMGTHEELLKNCETYREIAESQLSKEELYGKEVAE
ncbi:ABC transporter ATP-binding protein [Howardella ureilytica]